MKYVFTFVLAFLIFCVYFFKKWHFVRPLGKIQRGRHQGIPLFKGGMPSSFPQKGNVHIS